MGQGRHGGHRRQCKRSKAGSEVSEVSPRQVQDLYRQRIQGGVVNVRQGKAGSELIYCLELIHN